MMNRVTNILIILRWFDDDDECSMMNVCNLSLGLQFIIYQFVCEIKPFTLLNLI